MKPLIGNLFVAAIAGILTSSATSAFGQIGQVITLDENGHGYITPSQPFGFNIATEPVSGAATLRYSLPFAGVAGDILLKETTGGPISDILRFDGQSHVYFFSDGSAGIDSLADVPRLPDAIAPSVSLLEQGQEGGFQYIYYTPAAGDPGFKPAAPGTTYYISVVPEPRVTMMLGCMGAGLLLLRTLRRKAGGD